MITPEIVVAYTQCKLKAYFLLCTDKKGKSHEYISILQNETSRNRSEFFNKIKTEMTGSEPYSPRGMKRGIPALLEATLSFDDLEIYTDAIIKKRNFYSPVLVVGTQKINKEQRLQLGFIGYVLSKFQKKKAVSGTIIGKGNKKHLCRSDKLRHFRSDKLRRWITHQAAAQRPEPATQPQ
jgi:hypothetical protein